MLFRSIIDVIWHAGLIESFDFKLSAEDYANLYLVLRETTDIKSGRTDYNMPTLSFAGLSFTMMTIEETDKYLILK